MLTILRKVSVSGGTVLRASNNLGDVANPATARTNLGVNSVAEVAALRTGLAPRPGIISTGASAVGTTQDNTGLAFGTGDLSIGAWVRLPDWTPSATKMLLYKFQGALGIQFWVGTDGKLKLQLNATGYTSSVATGVADGAWAFVSATLDRDGNMVFYVNGAALGTVVDISALSAATITQATPLLWGSDGSHTAGTLGETFIISGLLTATNIADIYKAGSIAPFSASFTFFQWCDFGQGYGPIIKDRSGQNQPALMGASGLTHAVPLTAPARPSRAPRVAVVADGSTRTGISTLGTQDPASGATGVWADFDFPAAAGSADRLFFALSSSATTHAVARSLYGFVSTAGALSFVLLGATTNDYRQWTMAGAVSLFGGARRAVVFSRDTSGTPIVMIDGVNVWNLGTNTTAGTDPTWQGLITGTYFVPGSPNATYAWSGSLFDLRLANVAMTEAQLRTEYERGEPGPEWSYGTRVNAFTGDNSTFAGGLGNWAAGGSPTSVTNVAGTAQIVNTATSGGMWNGGINLSAYMGKRIRLTFNHQLTAGAIVTPWIVTDNNNIPTYLTGTTTLPSFTPAASQATFSAILDIPMVSGGTAILTLKAQVSETSTVQIDDVTLEQVGYTSRLRTDTAAGLTALDGSSNKNDFLLSTTGVTTSPNGRVQTIRATTNTSGNQQLAGASLIDTTKRWRIRSWNINSSGTPTVSLGNVSAGAQYLSGSALTATNNEVTLLTRIPGTANLWCNSSSTATLEHTVILEQVD